MKKKSLSTEQQQKDSGTVINQWQPEQYLIKAL